MEGRKKMFFFNIPMVSEIYQGNAYNLLKFNLVELCNASF